MPALPTSRGGAGLIAAISKRFEIGSFFGGVEPETTDDQLLRIAAGYPVFRIASVPVE